MGKTYRDNRKWAKKNRGHSEDGLRPVLEKKSRKSYRLREWQNEEDAWEDTYTDETE